MSKENMYIGAAAATVEQNNEETEASQNNKQNGQLMSLYTNLMYLLFVFRDKSNKKSGKYLSGLFLINVV